MTPNLDAYLVLRIVFWVVMFGAAVFILYAASGYLTGEPPTSVRRAALVVVGVAATVYLTYDVSGYLFFLAVQDPDIGIHLPAGFGYWDWFQEPLAVKWHVLKIVPIIRYIPVVTALCAGGVLFLFIWAIPWREAAVLFAAQLVLNAVALVALSFVFTAGARLAGVEVGPAAHGGEPEGPHDPQTPPPDLDRLDRRVGELPAVAGGVWRRLGARWDGVNGHLGPLYTLLSPVTRHLPPPAQDFLESGGWLLVFAGLAALFVVWPRFHRSPKRKRRRRPTPKPPEPRNKLSLIGDALMTRGPRQATVGGVPARLRLVVLVPTDPAARLTADAAPGLLEAVRPGLAEVARYDFPRVEVWPHIDPHPTFRGAFESDVEVPDPAGQPSRWVVLLGTATAGGGPVHVGLALYADAPTADRVVELPPGGWAGLVGLRDVPPADRD